MRRNPQLYTCDGPWPSHPLGRREPTFCWNSVWLSSALESPSWRDHLEGAVESATDDGAQVVAALAFANALGSDQRLAEAVEVCDRVAARLEGHNTAGHLVLEAMAVAIGSIDADVAPRTRACHCLDGAGRAQRPSPLRVGGGRRRGGASQSAGGSGSRLGSPRDCRRPAATSAAG